VTEAVAPEVPSPLKEHVLAMAAHGSGGAEPEPVRYVVAKQRDALRLVLGYVPIPEGTPSLDEDVFLFMLTGHFTAQRGPVSQPRATGSVMHVFVPVKTLAPGGTSIGDKRVDLSQLGPVGILDG
jgi:hypothetical protein